MPVELICYISHTQIYVISHTNKQKKKIYRLGSLIHYRIIFKLLYIFLSRLNIEI